MLTDLYTQRALIWAFANRDFKTRYRSSLLGWGWSLLQPLATLVVFAAVFSMVFRVQAPPLAFSWVIERFRKLEKRFQVTMPVKRKAA